MILDLISYIGVLILLACLIYFCAGLARMGYNILFNVTPSDWAQKKNKDSFKRIIRNIFQ